MIRLSLRPIRVGYMLGFLTGILLLTTGSLARGYETHAVAWRNDLGSAQAEARSRNLPLWIQFTGPWCVNCRRMERGAFVTPSIVGLSQDKFVPVKLRSDEHEQLALSLGLSVLPSTVLVKPTGEVIDKWEGYGEPGEFLVYLETILEREAKNKKPDVALASYCPVSLVEKHKLIIGQDGVTAKHDGSIYKFVDQAAKTAFLASPEKYVPANHGECPVKQVDGGVFQAGQPRWGVLYKGHLYLCADQTERDQFIKNPVRYANVDLASRNKCPHCWGGSGKDGQQLAQAPGRASTAGNSAPVAPPRSNSILPPPSVLMEALLAPVMRIRR